MPNLTSQHHFTFLFLDSWIGKAKKIRNAEDEIPGKNKVYSAYRWSGKLGEWAFYSIYKHMTPITSDFKAEDKDFKSGRTGLTYDTKVKNAEGPFRDDYHADLNKGQYLKGKGKVDIYVFVYYQLGTDYLRFCGWLYYDQVASRGELWKKGKVFRGFPVKSDKYTIYYKDLNSMHLLEEVVKEQT